MTDSYHFQIEPEPRAEVPKFRIGGVYRDNSGDLVRLTSKQSSGRAFAEIFSKHDNCWNPYPAGFDMNTGKWRCSERPDDLMNLIPGELVERDGQWVAADSIGPFPSGATLKVAGDKIVGRVEAQPESEVERAVRTILNSPMKRRDNLPPAPLPHFNQRTEFDAFPDYVVFHEFEPVAPLHTSPTTDSAYPAIAGLLRG